jgi:peroxiredoxin
MVTPMLKRGQVAPDFRVGDRSLYEMLKERSVVVFFFPKAFTPG